MSARQITEQYEAGLISRNEARDALQQLQKNSQFSADYSDTLNSYKRHSKIAENARLALRDLMRGTTIQMEG